MVECWRGIVKVLGCSGESPGGRERGGGGRKREGGRKRKVGRTTRMKGEGQKDGCRLVSVVTSNST